MEIRIGSFSLTGDIPAEQCADFKIVASSEIQISKPIQAATGSGGGGRHLSSLTFGGADETAGIKLFDRGNDQHAITFGIWREHLLNHVADKEGAYRFLVAHCAAVRAIGVSFVTLLTKSGTFYFNPAFARITECHTIGCSSFHAYSIVAGAISDKPPAGGLSAF